ncbi:conserved hypothetical protein [Coccidioides posadasii str. Silveira]|uniref:Uncharacterized protein n=1 Tax=Coccidioides posadasii (strain RMSCC 757 / Silveira) TaxID=443226 RepID=E9D2S6_COCPS|nr:conserved hypothetical protein [Coccidioides posadasii str. Silveira]
MGRKKNSARKNKEPQWDEIDKHHLIGCLDHLLYDREITDSRAIREEIKSCLQRSRGKNFAIGRISEKLQEIQNEHAHGIRRGTLLTRGSKVLKDIDHEEVKRFAGELKSQHTASILQSDGRRLRNTPKRAELRAHLRPHANIVTRSMSAVRSMSETPTPNKVKRKRSTKTEKSERPYAETQLALGEKAPPEKATQLPITRGRSAYQVLGSRLHRELSVPDSQEAYSTTENGRSPQSRNVDSRRELEHEYKMELMRLQKDLNTMQVQLEDAKKLRDAALGNLATTREKHDEAVQKIKALKCTIAEIDPERGNIANKVVYQEERILALERALQQTRISASFAGLRARSDYSPRESTVEELMQEIEGEMRQILFAFDACPKMHLINLKDRGESRTLLARSLDVDCSQMGSPGKLTVDLQYLGLRTIVHAITAAALCDWVFGHDFEHPPLLLDMYRRHLLLMGTQSSVQNLDLAAHKSLFESKEYQEVIIPLRAEHLADRLATALSPFSNGESGDWELDNHKKKDLMDCLTDIFELALKLKVHLLPSGKQYFCLLYPPGSKFDPKAMVPESRHGDRNIPYPDELSEIEICVFPAICARRKDDGGFISYQFTVQNSMRLEADVSVLQKAVVVVRYDRHNCFW